MVFTIETKRADTYAKAPWSVYKLLIKLGVDEDTASDAATWCESAGDGAEWNSEDGAVHIVAEDTY